jgi:signal peptidase I
MAGWGKHSFHLSYRKIINGINLIIEMTIAIIFLFIILESAGILFIIHSTKSGFFKKKTIQWFFRAVLITVYSLMVIGILRTHCLDVVRISGKSMENFLFEGNMVLVNKIALLTEGIKKGEIYVFRDATGSLSIKRCIGVSGDKIRIEDGTVYIKEIEQDYIKRKIEVFMDENLSFALLLDSLNINETKSINHPIFKFGYELFVTEKQGNQLKEFEHIKTIRKSNDDQSENGDRYPNSLTLKSDSLSEIIIPNGKKGKNVYVLFMGDNRDNSIDSRLLGYVSSDDIIGRIVD